MRIRGYLIKVLLYLIALAILYLPVAMAYEVCLSKHEARKLWPKQHLYWYGPNHCWSNRRGPPHKLRIDPIYNSHAQVQVAEAVIETKTDQVTIPVNSVDNWGKDTQPLKVRIIEIAPPVMSAPITPVETVDISALPTAPPSLLLRLASWAGGALSAFTVAFLFVFNGKVLIYVKRSLAWLHKGLGAIRQKVSSVSFGKRDIESPLPPLDIRHFLRRADRAGRRDHLAKVYDCLADAGDPCDPYEPEDHSAIACWARSLRP